MTPSIRPISVHEKMWTLGMEPVPSVASLARTFRNAGVAKTEPKKEARLLLRRFIYPAPNACWRLDATEYILTGGRKCVIFHSPTMIRASPSPLTSPGAERPKPRSSCEEGHRRSR